MLRLRRLGDRGVGGRKTLAHEHFPNIPALVAIILIVISSALFSILCWRLSGRIEVSLNPTGCPDTVSPTPSLLNDGRRSPPTYTAVHSKHRASCGVGGTVILVRIRHCMVRFLCRCICPLQLRDGTDAPVCRSALDFCASRFLRLRCSWGWEWRLARKLRTSCHK